MFKNQRHAQLLELLKAEGFAEVRALSARLFASQPTIRRDLDFLEKQGFVHRSHGGAILADGSVNTPVSFRRGTRTQEKLRICRLAASLLSADSLIFTDGSTTVSYLAEQLKESDGITVVTNGYSVCRTLAENNVRTFSTGGRLLRNSLAFVGQRAEETVRQFNADLFFFSCAALSADGMISDYSEEETALRQCMRRQSKKTVFLCDSAKIGKQTAFYAFSLSEIDYLVTDAPLPEQLLLKVPLALELEQDHTYLYHNTTLPSQKGSHSC